MTLKKEAKPLELWDTLVELLRVNITHKEITIPLVIIKTTIAITIKIQTKATKIRINSLTRPKTTIATITAIATTATTAKTATTKIFQTLLRR